MFIKLIVLRKNIKNLHFYNHIKKIVPIILFSCVYYNTFYNAEVNYKKAEKLIAETSPDDSKNDKIPAQAKKLLGQAIENSLIVIESYPNSKYVDDAYFMIGKASFLRKEFYNAEKYLKQLIDLYPNSEYYIESQIWLIYTYLKMNDIELAKQKLANLEDSDIENQFLINNILAEISIENDSPFEAYNYYNKCISVAKEKSKKTSVYLKLLNLSKNYSHLDSSIAYLDKLSEYTSGQMKKEIKLDWIKYSREAKNFNDLLIEIDIMLANSEYSNIYIKLELERAKIYLDQNDFESAKIFLSELSDTYSRKNESAEALYHLGYIALMESFDLDLALEYFEKSKKDRKSSLYGKRSRDMINRINDYKNLKQELEYILNKVAQDDNVEEEVDESINRRMMPKPRMKKDPSPDSLLFVISEKLLFDFDRLEDAKESYKTLISSYKESKFRPQALYVLNFYFPDEEWIEILESDYPQSEFNLNGAMLNDTQDNIEFKRDLVWEICENSYSLCTNEFLKLFNTDGDHASLYLYAFINDNYLNRIGDAVSAYKEYVKIDSDLQYINEAQSRLNEIEDNIYSSIELTNQRINYYYALESLQLGEDLDSVLVKINNTINGGFSKYKSSAQLLKSRMNKLVSLKENIELSKNDSIILNPKIDSLYYIIAKIYQLDFIMDDSASYYYAKVINDFPKSKFKYPSITALNDIKGDWTTYLQDNYPDSIYVSDSSYKQVEIIDEIYQESFIDYEINRLEDLNYFSNLFMNQSDSIGIVDTTNVKLDTLNRVIDDE